MPGVEDRRRAGDLQSEEPGPIRNASGVLFPRRARSGARAGADAGSEENGPAGLESASRRSAVGPLRPPQPAGGGFATLGVRFPVRRQGTRLEHYRRSEADSGSARFESGQHRIGVAVDEAGRHLRARWREAAGSARSQRGRRRSGADMEEIRLLDEASVPPEYPGWMVDYQKIGRLDPAKNRLEVHQR